MRAGSRAGSPRSPRRVASSRCSPLVHVLEARLLAVVHDRNVASLDPICVLERALERAAGELELRGQPGAARLAREFERGQMRRPILAIGERDQQVDDVGRGRLLRRRQQDPLEPAAQPMPGVGCPPSCSISRS